MSPASYRTAPPRVGENILTGRHLELQLGSACAVGMRSGPSTNSNTVVRARGPRSELTSEDSGTADARAGCSVHFQVVSGWTDTPRLHVETARREAGHRLSSSPRVRAAASSGSASGRRVCKRRIPRPMPPPRSAVGPCRSRVFRCPRPCPSSAGYFRVQSCADSPQDLEMALMSGETHPVVRRQLTLVGDS